MQDGTYLFLCQNGNLLAHFPAIVHSNIDLMIVVKVCAYCDQLALLGSLIVFCSDVSGLYGIFKWKTVVHRFASLSMRYCVNEEEYEIYILLKDPK